MTQNAILLEDIHSYGKGAFLYGKKGEKVKIIRIDEKVAIVEGKEKFPISVEKIKIIK